MRQLGESVCSLGSICQSFSRRRSAKFVLVFLLAAVAISLVTFGARAWHNKRGSAVRQDPVAAQPNPVSGRWRNGLAFQPEADKLRRRLGRRFLAPGREVSVLAGALTLGSERYTAQITRRQDDDDERVMIALNGGPRGAWSGLNGAAAADGLRSLVERIALDSPDQFILAQLRGSAYYTVARMVRPSEAGDSDTYTGPLWNVVRVTESPTLTQNNPRSPWRLYYINTATGLIDKVISEEQGQTIVAEISGWAAQNGEQIPSHISWTVNKQVVMEFSLTNVLHGPRQ
jgi:hypothetical protein